MTKWTEEEDAILKKMVVEDRQYMVDIAAAMGRSVGSIAGRCDRLDIKCDRKPSEHRPRKKSVKKTNLPEKLDRNKYDFGAFAPSRRTLPHLVTKSGTLLHVYARDPYVLLPLATYERRGEKWVRRGDAAVFRDTPSAVRALELFG